MRTFHKHQRNGRLTARGWFVLFVGVAILPAIHTAQHVPAPQASTAAPTQVHHYESPCYLRERTARGIPASTLDDNTGLAAYVRQHLRGSTPDAELADYWAALDRCRENEPVGKWAWDSMILVSVEKVP